MTWWELTTLPNFLHGSLMAACQWSRYTIKYKLSLKTNQQKSWLMSSFGEISIAIGVWRTGTKFSVNMVFMIVIITTGRLTRKLWSAGDLEWQGFRLSMRWWEKCSIVASCQIEADRLSPAILHWIWNKTGASELTGLKKSWLIMMSIQTLEDGQELPVWLVEKFSTSTLWTNPQNLTQMENS